MDVDVKPESRLVPSSFSSERLSLVEDIDKDDQVFVHFLLPENRSASIIDGSVSSYPCYIFLKLL